MRRLWSFFCRVLFCRFGWHDYAPQIVWGWDEHRYADFDLEDFCFHCGRPRHIEVKNGDS